MKIALIIEHFLPQGGGAERSTAQIAHELMERGHTVTIYSAALNRGQQVDDFDLRPMCRAPRINAWTLWRFNRYVRRQLAGGGFDASLSVTTAAPANVLQPRSGTVRETQLRNVAIRSGAATQGLKRWSAMLSPKKQLLLSLERRTLRDAMVRRILAVSLYVARQLRQHYGVDESRIEVLPNAAQMPTTNEDDRRTWRKQVRESFRVPEDEPVYLFAAHNPRLKGLDSLLRATKLLADRDLPGTLLLAGRTGDSRSRANHRADRGHA